MAVKMTEAQILRAQVEYVHGLTGGELDSKPRRMLALKDSWRAKRRRVWLRFTYDGVPEYATQDYRADLYDADYFTALWDSGAYGDHKPPRALYRAGKLYRLIQTYASGAECECPGRTTHECYGHEEHPTTLDDYKPPVSVVTRAEAMLTPKPSGHIRDPYTGKVYPRRARCPLCEARIGEAHGFIYLGEGWLEAVYRAAPAREEDEG